MTLIVATTIDPASIGPASALLAMPGWHPGPPIQDTPSFVNQDVRLLKHDSSIVREDHLDTRWEETTGETVDEVIFLSKHTAASNRPALTVHPIGVPHLIEGEQLPVGGKPAWAAPPNPRIGPWFRLLKSIADSQNLTPEFEVTLEATHHGPVTNAPTMFVEIGSTEEYWKRQDAAQAIALVGYPFTAPTLSQYLFISHLFLLQANPQTCLMLLLIALASARPIEHFSAAFITTLGFYLQKRNQRNTFSSIYKTIVVLYLL